MRGNRQVGCGREEGNVSVVDVTLETETIQTPRPPYLPAIRSTSGGTEESEGPTVQMDGDYLEMKSLDTSFDDFAIAV